MAEIFGRKDGLCGGKGGSMHIADLSKGMMGANGIVGGGPPLICGAALTAKTLKTGGVAIAFVGDGGSNQGTTAESMNLAKVWNLPAIFVFEDNGYAEIDRQLLGGAPAIWSSAARPTASRRAASTATTSSRSGTPRARRSSGRATARGRASSTSSSMRYYGHFEGDAMTYRAPGEIDTLKAEKDCLQLFRQRVTEAGLLEPDQLDAIDREAKQPDRAGRWPRPRRRRAPTEADLLTDVYATY